MQCTGGPLRCWVKERLSSWILTSPLRIEGSDIRGVWPQLTSRTRARSPRLLGGAADGYITCMARGSRLCNGHRTAGELVLFLSGSLTKYNHNQVMINRSVWEAIMIGAQCRAGGAEIRRPVLHPSPEHKGSSEFTLHILKGLGPRRSDMEQRTGSIYRLILFFLLHHNKSHNLYFPGDGAVWWLLYFRTGCGFYWQHFIVYKVC